MTRQMLAAALAAAVIASAHAAARPAADRAASPREDARFRRAVALVRAHRPAEALPALHGLGRAFPELADRVWFLRGRSLEALGRRGEATAAYARVPDGSLRAAAARLARARLLAASGAPGEAVEALGPLLATAAPARGGPDPAATALLLAGRLRSRGPGADLRWARRALAECWSAHPLAPEAARCLAALRALPGGAGAPPGPRDLVRRAEVLLRGGRPAAAAAALRAALRRLGGDPGDAALACRARAALGEALERERRYGPAAATIRRAAACPERPPRVLLLLGRALARAGQPDAAIATYRDVARRAPGSPASAEAHYAAAALLASAGRTAEAEAALARVARAAPGANLRYEALFRRAWLARRAGDLGRALAQLLALEAAAAGRDPYEEARAAYWRARILAGRGADGHAAALRIWSDLSARFPAGYYGAVARARLAELGAAAAPPVSARPEAAPAGAPTADAGRLERDAHFRAGVTLLRLGLDRDAADELNAVAPARLDRDGGAPALVVAELLHRAGDAGASSLLLRTHGRAALDAAPDAAHAAAWRLAYPPAYRADVVRWARRAGLPPDLFHALVREESGLDPRAVSPAGAVGLAQLMLPTARELARRLRLRPPTRAALTRPALSIRLGTRMLATLLRASGGSIPLALAAYNAGPGAVARWRAARAGLDWDEFVEEIPYDETRGYVKRVIRSFAAYRLLYGGAHPAPLALTVPLPGAAARRAASARAAPARLRPVRPAASRR